MLKVRACVRGLVAVASGLTLMALRFMTPRRRHVVVAGWGQDEPNASELVRALTRRYSGQIWWIAPPAIEMRRAVGVEGHPQVCLAPQRWSWGVVRAYLTAEVVFTTHGIYGMPASPRRKPVVNIWHGEMAKGGGDMFPFRRLPGAPASHLLVASEKLTEAKLSRSGVSREGIIRVANPRVDQLRRPASDEMLMQLGIDVSSPFVVWMPTFRQGKDSAVNSAWINTSDPLSDEELHERLARLVLPRLTEAGIHLVVKPHPLDLLTRGIDTATVVLTEDLERCGTPLYSLLGRSSGLITDYSSVWVDCLTTRLPTAFFMPDRGAYESGRGTLPDGGYDVLPGPLLDDESAVIHFVEDVLARTPRGEAARSAAITHLGLDCSLDAAERTLELVSAATSLRLRPGARS